MENKTQNIQIQCNLPTSYVPGATYNIHEVVEQYQKVVDLYNRDVIQNSRLPVCKEGLEQYPSTFNAAINQDGSPCSEGIMTEQNAFTDEEVVGYVALGGPLGCTFDKLKTTWEYGGFPVVNGNLEQYHRAKKIIIKTNKNIKFNLLYDKNRSLQKKIKIEQIRKEIN